MRSRRIAWTLALVVSIALAGGCSGDAYRSLHRGQCLPVAAQVIGEREPDPPTVSCGEPHRYEVYAVARLEGGRTYPGDAAVDELAQHECYLQFEPNVGYLPEEMPGDVKVLYLQPSESSWNDDADRDVECLLAFSDDRSEQVLPDRAATTTSTTTVPGSGT